MRSTIANIPTPDLTIDDHCDMTRMVIAFIYSNVHGDNEIFRKVGFQLKNLFSTLLRINDHLENRCT